MTFTSRSAYSKLLLNLLLESPLEVPFGLQQPFSNYAYVYIYAHALKTSSLIISDYFIFYLMII